MKRRQRFEEILGAARSTFAAQGYHATSVSDIVQASGVARGTFYLYFEGKRAVFDALLDRFVDAITERVHVVRVGPGKPSPYAQLRGNVGRVFDLLLEQREIGVILLEHAVGLDASADAKLRDFEDAMTDLLQRALGTGERLGLVEPRNHELTARVILGAIKEVVRHYVVGQRSELSRDEIVDEVMAVCLRGVVGGPIDPLLGPLPGDDDTGVS